MRPVLAEPIPDQDAAVSTPSVARQPKPRFAIIDSVKGFAITLVVFGHTAQGMQHRSWWVTPSSLFTTRYIYSFHMAAFFLVAGLFAMQSLRKRGARRFTIDKLRTLLYPYLLWSLIAMLTARLTIRWRLGSIPSWRSFLTAVLSGDASWFLITLFACMMLFIATAGLRVGVRIVVAVAVACLMPVTGILVLDEAIAYFPYLAVGIAAGAVLLVRLEEVSRLAALAGGALVLLYEAYLVHSWTTLTRVDILYLGLTGSLGLLLLSRGIEATALGRAVAWVGEGSLGIFLLSSYFQGAGRELVRQLFHTTAVWPQLVIPSVFALLFPAVLWHLSTRIRPLNWLFTWPAR